VAKLAIVTGAALWAASLPANHRGIEVTNDNNYVVIFGQLSGADVTAELTDANGKTTTLRSRGSYDLFVAKMSAVDGAGIWAMDGGGTGMDYFWGMSMDANDNILISGYTRSPVLTFGDTLTKTNPNTDGENHAYTIRLSGADTALPSCVSSCVANTAVVSTGCFINHHCIAEGATSPYSGQRCHKCLSASSTTAWTDPGTHCYIDGKCYDDGQDKPPPPAPSRYGRHLSSEHEEDDTNEAGIDLREGFHRKLQGYGGGSSSSPPPPVCMQCDKVSSPSSWTIKTGVDYIAVCVL
jgi:hypothetical protein